MPRPAAAASRSPAYSAEVEALRKVILATSPEVREEEKWNAPSFRTTCHFATFNLRGKDGLRLILHRDAKKRSSGQVSRAAKVEDDSGVLGLEWLGEDRAMLVFEDTADIKKKAKPLQALLRAWMKTL